MANVEAHPVIITAPGEEAQVDYGEGPMIFHPKTGRYRRSRLFVLTLGYSRKCVRLLTMQSSSRIWAELHEWAFRNLGGATKTVVLDNKQEDEPSIGARSGRWKKSPRRPSMAAERPKCCPWRPHRS
jgi:transposase